MSRFSSAYIGTSILSSLLLMGCWDGPYVPKPYYVASTIYGYGVYDSETHDLVASVYDGWFSEPTQVCMFADWSPDRNCKQFRESREAGIYIQKEIAEHMAQETKRQEGGEQIHIY